MIGLIFQTGALHYFTFNLQYEKRKIDQLAKNYDEQTLLLNELRRQRNDLQKHLDALLHTDLQSEEASQYKQEILSRFTKVDHIAQHESNVMAGALYAHYEQAKKKSVKLEYYTYQPLSSLPIEQHDLIALIGNILENAIDAAATYGEGHVSLICRKQSGIWIITCENDTVPLDNDIIERLFTTRAISTKGGQHEGFGTQEIRRIVDQYGGTLDFSAIDTKFHLKIKLPDIR